MIIKQLIANLLIRNKYKQVLNCFQIALCICIIITMTYITISTILNYNYAMRNLLYLQFTLKQTQAERHDLFLQRNEAYSTKITLTKENANSKSTLYSINLEIGHNNVIQITKTQLISYYKTRVDEFNTRMKKIDSMKDVFNSLTTLSTQISFVKNEINHLKSYMETPTY